MKTPWGDIPILDCHVHFFSHNFFRSLAQQKGGVTVDELGRLLNWRMPPEEPEELAGAWVQELDRPGVGRAPLIASVHGDEESVDAAVRRRPDRFFGYFMLNPLAPDAVERVQRACAGKHLHAVCLFPAMHRYSVNDDRVRQILRLMAGSRNLLVFVHCGALSLGVRNRLGLSSPFDMRFSNPIDLHPLAIEFPSLSFVIPHFGAGYFREALMLCDLCPNVCIDTSSSNRWMRYQPAEMRLETVFRRALDVVGPSRLLFGTDSSFFPRGWNREIFDQQLAALEKGDVNPEQAALIFGGNLARLLASPNSAAARR